MRSYFAAIISLFFLVSEKVCAFVRMRVQSTIQINDFMVSCFIASYARDSLQLLSHHLGTALRGKIKIEQCPQCVNATQYAKFYETIFGGRTQHTHKTKLPKFGENTNEKMGFAPLGKMVVQHTEPMTISIVSSHKHTNKPNKRDTSSFHLLHQMNWFSG